MKKTLSVLLVILCINCEAQVSGYMGKKWIILFNVNARPSFVEPNQNGNSGIKSLNVMKALTLEYIPARIMSMGIAYGFFETKFDFTKAYVDVGEISNYTDPSFIPSGQGSISAKDYSFNLKFFLGNDIAPLGAYIKLQMDYFDWNYSYDWRQSFVDAYNPKYNKFFNNFPFTGSYHSFGLSFSYGTQRVLFNHLVINTSMQFGYLFKGGATTWREVQNDEFYDKDATVPLPLINTVTSARMFQHYLWNMNIGIGYLIF